MSTLGQISVRPVSVSAAGAAADTTALFLTFMPGPHHGTALGCVIEELGFFIAAYDRLRDVMKTAVNCYHERGDYKADVRVDPIYRAHTRSIC